MVENNTSKIPCYVTVFFDFENTKKALDYITRYNDKLDIIVLENKSENTETQIKPYISNLLDENKIEKYFLFEKNIAANALKLAFIHDIDYIMKHDKLMFHDGDLLFDNDNWLEEEVSILEENPEVFAVGAQLDMSNLPSPKVCPGSENWIPKGIEHEDKNYIEGLTGNWFMLFKMIDVVPVLLDIVKNDYPFIDGTLHQYCYRLLNKRWARTKNQKHTT